MPDTPVPAAEAALRIAPSAAKRIAQLVREEDDADVMFRVSVSGGGCSGFQYGFSLDSETTADDQVFETGGVRVVVDTLSLELLRGAELVYVDDLMGAYFKLDNPNAASTCGCGSSFAI